MALEETRVLFFGTRMKCQHYTQFAQCNHTNRTYLTWLDLTVVLLDLLATVELVVWLETVAAVSSCQSDASAAAAAAADVAPAATATMAIATTTAVAAATMEE